MKTKKINFHEATTIKSRKSSSKVVFNYGKKKTFNKEETLKKYFRKADTMLLFDPRVHMNLSKTDIQNLDTYKRYKNMKWMVDVSKLYTGYSFGELALVNNEPRNATIQCLNDCYFAVLEKPDYKRVLKNIQLK